MPDTHRPVGGELRRHWTLLLPCLAGIVLLTVHTYSLGAMVEPLQQQFGWSRAQIYGGNMLVAVAALLGSPIVGRAVDHFGSRPVAIVGVVGYGLTLALLSSATADIWSWWLRWILLGIASTIIMPTVWVAAINGVFDVHRGKALAVAMLGSGLCAAVVPLCTTILLDRLGWRGTYVALAGTASGIVLLLVVFFFRGADDHATGRRRASVRPEPTGYTARAGIRSGAFIKLGLAVFVFGSTCLAVTINAVPLLESLRLDRTTAASIAGLLGLGSIAGRLLGGVLLDRFEARWVAAIAVTTPVFSIALLLLLPGNPITAGIAMAFFGLSLGAEVDTCAYLAARHFGMRAFGLLFGTINGFAFFGAGVAPVLANALYDATGSYAIMLWASMPLCALSAVLFLSLGRYPDPAMFKAGHETPSIASGD